MKGEGHIDERGKGDEGRGILKEGERDEWEGHTKGRGKG